MRGLPQPWTRSSIIPISKGKSVCRNKRPRKKTVSFEVDRLLTWSTITSRSLEPMILSKTMPTYWGNLWPKRLLVSRKENLVLQIERENLWKKKKNASWKITIERGNLWKEARTKCKKLVLSNIVMTWISSHLAIDDENIDFNISGVPNAMVKRSQSISVHNLIQQIENHPQRGALQSDLQQHRAFNPFSKEWKDAIMAAGNTELCEIIDVEPKLQCKACLSHWSTGIVYCTCGHLMKDDTTENKKYISSVLDLFSIPNFYIRKGGPHGHRYTGKQKDAKSTTQQIEFKRGVAKRNMTTFTTDSSATSYSEKRWLSWDALKRSSLRWIGLQAKTTVILPPKQKLTYTVATGGFARTWWISIRCQQGINLTSRKHCRHCTASRKREDKKHYKKCSQSSSSWWQWQTNLVGTRLWEFTTKMEVTTDWTGETCVFSVAPIHLRYESQHEMNAKFIVNISVNADSSLLSPTGSVNTILPDTEIHEQLTTINGYGKVCTTTSTLPASVRP